MINALVADDLLARLLEEAKDMAEERELHCRGLRVACGREGRQLGRSRAPGGGVAKKRDLHDTFTTRYYRSSSAVTIAGTTWC